MNYISWYLKFWVSFVNECWFKPMLVGSSFVKCVRNKKRYHMHVEIKKKSSRIQTTPRIVQQQRWQGCRDRHYSNE